jgi:hypothetical protein
VDVHRPITDAHLRQLAEGVVITTPVQRDRVDKLVTAMTRPCQVRRVGAHTFRIRLNEVREFLL